MLYATTRSWRSSHASAPGNMEAEGEGINEQEREFFEVTLKLVSLQFVIYLSLLLLLLPIYAAYVCRDAWSPLFMFDTTNALAYMSSLVDVSMTAVACALCTCIAECTALALLRASCSFFSSSSS